MTSGVRRAILPVAALMAVAIGMPPAAGADPGVEELMRSLAQVGSRTARFVERKHVAILNTPLESSGTLIYTAPARLEKHTVAPRAESLVLDGDRLTLEDKGRDQKRTIALAEHPVIQAFVEGVRSTLAGDLATLNRFYQVALDGNERRWRLTLRPREQRMQDFVSEIRISGSLDRIRTIEIVETEGDRSVMTVTPVEP
jgi:hypothetical protein